MNRSCTGYTHIVTGLPIWAHILAHIDASKVFAPVFIFVRLLAIFETLSGMVAIAPVRNPQTRAQDSLSMGAHFCSSLVYTGQ